MNRVVLALAVILLIAFGATAQTTNGLSEAEIQGRQLAQQLCETQPTEDLTNTGVLEIHDGHGNRTNFSVSCEIIVTATNWQNVYQTIFTNKYLNGYPLPGINFYQLSIIHAQNQTNEYDLSWRYLVAEKELGQDVYAGSFGNYRDTRGHEKWFGTQWTYSFSGSDFWAVDLGLEFFHWPEQKVLKHETRRTRACTVLESTNPDPAPGSYSKVVSWIDDETLGIVHAEAYDANGKLLKEFDPKSFKKVNGQWELQDMEIQSVQTRSRTWIKFDLK
jgi:hypothetical protein